MRWAGRRKLTRRRPSDTARRIVSRRPFSQAAFRTRIRRRWPDGENCDSIFKISCTTAAVFIRLPFVKLAARQRPHNSERQRGWCPAAQAKWERPCAIAGSVLLFIGTYLHPMSADPNQAAAAFAEYAADPLWVASHLTQLAGVAPDRGRAVAAGAAIAGGERRGLGRDRGRGSDRRSGGGRGPSGRGRDSAKVHGGCLGSGGPRRKRRDSSTPLFAGPSNRDRGWRAWPASHWVSPQPCMGWRCCSTGRIRDGSVDLAMVGGRAHHDGRGRDRVDGVFPRWRWRSNMPANAPPAGVDARPWRLHVAERCPPGGNPRPGVARRPHEGSEQSGARIGGATCARLNKSLTPSPDSQCLVLPALTNLLVKFRKIWLKSGARHVPQAFHG